MIEVADRVYVTVAQADPARERDAARALLRRLLAELDGPGAGDTRILKRRNGQPFLPERPDRSVSLSHSEGWVAAAVGAGPEVGVDVQVPQPTPAGLVRRCCRPAARDLLARMPAAGRDLEFAWIWTAQEACVKATGAGLAGLPWTIPVEVGQRAGAWGRVRWRSLRDRYRTPVTCAYTRPGVDG